jgi:Flp pilus assembly protein TadG
MLMRVLRSKRGAATMIVALTMVGMLGMAALVVDVGSAYAFKEKCEFVMEAAALAAARVLPDTTQATSVARQVVLANGLNPDLLTIHTPIDGAIYKVRCAYTDTRATVIARVLNIDLFNFAAQATANRGGSDVFDYALFSGSTLEDLRIGGSTLDVLGSVHSNEDLRFNGATINVSGALEAAQKLVNNGNSVINAGEIKTYDRVIPMPVYSTSELRDMCATRYGGNTHLSGGTLDVTGGVFVDGTLQLTGVTVTGRGLLVASGNITLNGTDFRYFGPGDAVCVYTQQNISIEGNTFVAQGMFYAPHGIVNCSGTSPSIEGSIIADELDFSGSQSISIVYSDAAKWLLPDQSVRLVR